jgi:hypothetical protein
MGETVCIKSLLFVLVFLLFNYQSLLFFERLARRADETDKRIEYEMYSVDNFGFN